MGGIQKINSAVLKSHGMQKYVKHNAEKIIK